MKAKKPDVDDNGTEDVDDAPQTNGPTPFARVCCTLESQLFNNLDKWQHLERAPVDQPVNHQKRARDEDKGNLGVGGDLQESKKAKLDVEPEGARGLGLDCPWRSEG